MRNIFAIALLFLASPVDCFATEPDFSNREAVVRGIAAIVQSCAKAQDLGCMNVCTKSINEVTATSNAEIRKRAYRNCASKHSGELTSSSAGNSPSPSVDESRIIRSDVRAASPTQQATNVEPHPAPSRQGPQPELLLETPEFILYSYGSRRMWCLGKRGIEISLVMKKGFDYAIDLDQSYRDRFIKQILPALGSKCPQRPKISIYNFIYGWRLDMGGAIYADKDFPYILEEELSLVTVDQLPSGKFEFSIRYFEKSVHSDLFPNGDPSLTSLKAIKSWKGPPGVTKKQIAQREARIAEQKRQEAEKLRRARMAFSVPLIENVFFGNTEQYQLLGRGKRKFDADSSSWGSSEDQLVRSELYAMLVVYVLASDEACGGSTVGPSSRVTVSLKRSAAKFDEAFYEEATFYLPDELAGQVSYAHRAFPVALNITGGLRGQPSEYVKDIRALIAAWGCQTSGLAQFQHNLSALLNRLL